MIAQPRALLLGLLFAVTASGQGPSAPAGIRYVMPRGDGAIAIPMSDTWRPELLSLLDKDTRIVLQLKNQTDGLTASYSLFPNNTGTSTPQSCRAAVFDAVVSNIETNASLIDQQKSMRTTAHGEVLAVASFVIAKAGSIPLQQENLFGFFATARTCAEIHLSKVNFRPSDKAAMDATLDAFNFDPAYAPAPADYGLIATLFFNYFHDFSSAAVYYQRTLDTLSPSAITAPTASVLGRVTVTQLAPSYNLAGDLARSRAVDQAAIARDPTYPRYYYNLACIDAESGDAVAARNRLQQAFDRRANALPGEPFPDPTKDESLLKLKDDKDFWTFVQSLPKN